MINHKKCLNKLYEASNVEGVTLYRNMLEHTLLRFAYGGLVFEFKSSSTMGSSLELSVSDYERFKLENNSEVQFIDYIRGNTPDDIHVEEVSHNLTPLDIKHIIRSIELAKVMELKLEGKI